jgi:hypothetical protein
VVNKERKSDAGVGRKKATLTCGPATSAREREREGAVCALGRWLGSAQSGKGEGKVGRARGEGRRGRALPAVTWTAQERGALGLSWAKSRNERKKSFSFFFSNF